MKRTDTRTLAAATRVLAREIDSEDGVANAALYEAATRLDEFADFEDSLKRLVGK